MAPRRLSPIDESSATALASDSFLLQFHRKCQYPVTQGWERIVG